MTFGWHTTKLDDGRYGWNVYSFEHGKGQQYRKAGSCPTRAMAVARAKKWTLFFRRGGNADNPPLVLPPVPHWR